MHGNNRKYAEKTEVKVLRARGLFPDFRQDKVLRVRQCFSRYSFALGLVLKRLAQSTSRIEEFHLFSFARPIRGARSGVKGQYARCFSHDLKVLDGKDELVVESNPTIFKTQGQHMGMNYAIHILYKIWCCKSSGFWRLWNLTRLSWVLSSHGGTTLHI